MIVEARPRKLHKCWFCVIELKTPRLHLLRSIILIVIHNRKLEKEKENQKSEIGNRKSVKHHRSKSRPKSLTSYKFIQRSRKIEKAKIGSKINNSKNNNLWEREIERERERESTDWPEKRDGKFSVWSEAEMGERERETIETQLGCYFDV
jgi:hypothetical protein